MKIVFDKISSTPKHFELHYDSVLFRGTLKKSSHHRVTLESNLAGEKTMVCDRCGKNYSISLDIPLILTLSDTLLNEKDDLDSIEFLNGEIDLVYIVESELNALEGEYHYCEVCQNSSEPLEIEF